MRRVAAGVGLLVVMFMFLFVLEPLPVHASATLIQQNNAGVGSSSNPVMVSVTLGSNIASGDVLVVGLLNDAKCTVTSVTDTLVSFFTQAVEGNGKTFTLFVSIWTATLSSSGADTVTATFACVVVFSLPFDVFVYEVAGVTTSGLMTGTGSDTTASVSTSSVSFQPGAFLFGMVAHIGGTVTAGAGFTLSPENSGLGLSNGQWSDPVSSPTTFPATLSPSAPWVEAGVALNPVPTATTTTSATTFAPVHPVYVGGVMLPSIGFTVLLPWIIVLSLLGGLSVEAFHVKRREKQR